MKTFLKVTLVIFSIVVVGCSNQLAYKYADWWIEGQILDYLDLNRKQKTRLSLEIDKLHLWHQESELPNYRALLNQLEQRLLQQSDTTVADINAIESKIKQLWENLVDKASPIAASFLVELSPEQSEFLFDKIADENKKLLEENIELEDPARRKKGLKSMTEAAEEYFGRLSPEQKTAIKQWSEEFELSAEAELADRLAWQQQLRAALEIADLESRNQLIQTLLHHNESTWLPEKKRIREKNRGLRQQLFAKLLNSSSEKQRQKLLKEIRTYQTLLDKLARANL